MQLKRFFSILLAATLMCFAVLVPSSANAIEILKVGVVAESATPISSTPQIINQGEEVSVRVSISQNTGISFLKFKVNFDADAFEYVSHSDKSLFGAASIVNVKDNYLSYQLNLSTVISTNTGDILEIKFKTKSDYCGDAKFSAELFGKDEKDKAANCAKYETSSRNEHVPFEGESTEFIVHKVTTEGTVTAPTCLEEGFTTYKCDTCEKDVIVDIVKENGHTAGKAVVENEIKPNCLEKGSYDVVVYCSVCKAELERESHESDALDHDLVKHDAKEPNCTENGWYEYESCTRCDYSTLKEIPAIRHKIVYCNAKAPTCTEIGWDDYMYCTNEGCGYTTYKEIPALRHKITYVDGKAPTCTEDGWNDYMICSECDYSTQKIIPATGHDLVKNEAKAPTCTEIGWGAYDTCSRCDYSTYREIPAVGHRNEVVIGKEPTCTETGWTKYTKCAVCGVESFHASLPALGHDCIGHEAKAPTCTEIGWDAYDTCSRCDYTTYVEKAALGHRNEVIIGKEPTCGEAGWTKYTKCSVCGVESFHAILPATGEHIYNADWDAECDVCGQIREITYTGWVLEDDKWYRYEDGELVINKWRKDSVGWVFLGEDGAMLTNAWCEDSIGKCYVGADGYTVTNCWMNDGYAWIWFDSNGSMTKNAWVLDEGKWYYLGENGYMLSNAWAKDSIGWCYLGNNGAMMTNAWARDSKGWCYVGADGYVVTGTHIIDGRKCTFDANGNLITE